LNDTAWLDRVLAAAEPLDDRPAVRAVSLEDPADVVRFVRVLGIRDDFSRPLWKELRRQARGDARLFGGICSQGESLAGAYTAWAAREYSGKRHARLYWWIGPPEELDWIRQEAQDLLEQYKDTLASRGEFPVKVS
jgi:hypothetical protein